MDNEREKALEIVISQIERQYGKGAVMRLGDEQKRLAVEVIPTGSLALDMILGVGGIPKGRVTEIFGAEAAGKSTLVIHAMAETQKAGGVAAYIDVEHALDPVYAANCGVKAEDLLISQPDNAEQALEITEYLVRSGAVDLIVIDSVAALVPKAELEGDMGDSHMGLQARLMSQALRKLTSAINRSGTAIIFVNQLREKIGVVFGNPEVTPGGRALKFYSSVRIDLRRVDSIKVNSVMVGNRVRARVVKNKVAPPFMTAEFDIMFGKGISKEGDILELGVGMDLIKKTGAFYSYGEVRLGQGRENAKEYLAIHPEMAREIEGLIRSQNAALKPGTKDGKDALEPEPKDEQAAIEPEPKDGQATIEPEPENHQPAFGLPLA